MSTNRLYENSNARDLRRSFLVLDKLWSHFDFVPEEVQVKFRFDIHGDDDVIWTIKLSCVEDLIKIVGVDTKCKQFPTGTVWSYNPDLTKFGIGKEDGLEVNFYIDNEVDFGHIVCLKDLGVSL
tara:strand:- start:388 stop:759 length:372 start_codon:yes stop_codon:yes gene_type:complete